MKVKSMKGGKGGGEREERGRDGMTAEAEKTTE